MRRHVWLLLVALPAVLVLGIAAFVFVRTQHSLDRARVEVAREGRFPFSLRVLGRMENPGFETIASPATYTSGTIFRGRLYVTGPSGLFIYGGDNQTPDNTIVLLKSYRVGLDLPAAPLGQIVIGRLRGDAEPELLIATSGAGVLLFSPGSEDGAQQNSADFRQLLPEDADARDVTALLPLPTGELLIGTHRRGLLVYRGGAGNGGNEDKSLASFHPQLTGIDVTALAGDETGFWVGTRNRGVRHSHAGEIDNFDSELPDEQVDAIAVHGDKVYVGTPLGVEEFDGGRPARTLARSLFASALYADDKRLTIGSMDEGILRVSLDVSRRSGAIFAGSDEYGGEVTEPAEQFVGADAEHRGSLYAVMRGSLRREEESGNWTPLATVMDAPGKAPILTDENISALAFAPDGRLWVGYFDRGLDIVSPTGERTEHREDDHLFCVNRIVLDPRRQTMAVATANGLVLFDRQGKPRQVMTRGDGLIADHVSDIAFNGDSMVLATPAGLTFVDANGARSLYAFEGLVNNHVYALGANAQSDEILAGTLGGISELVHESVTRNLTTTSSGLQHNWITAMVPAGVSAGDNSWMVGTYGAGVMLLDKEGRFTPMEGATAKMAVNPNAMLATDTHILAGTLGNGLWVWSRGTGRWSQVTAGLPSGNVTAIAERDGEIYVGTDNGLVRIAERLLN